MAVRLVGRVVSRLSGSWYREKQNEWNSTELRMATDILRLATQYAPVDQGHLRASGRIEKGQGSGVKVVFGGDGNGFSVPYAKRRHYENKKNPQTLRYLERAGDQVVADKDKYFGVAQ